MVHFEDGLTSAGVRELADAIAAVCTGTSAVLSGTEGNFSVCLVNKNADIKEFGTAMNKTLNGRGGGKTGCIQGSLKATRSQIEAFFKF